MRGKQWVKIWISMMLIIPIIAVVNFVVDPLGYNYFYYKLNFNHNKNIRIDERILKFNLLNNDTYDIYMFGSSRNTIMNPEIVNSLTKKRAVNCAFSSATIDEMEI